jgi:phosphoserine phosphatase RsbU/P
MTTAAVVAYYRSESEAIVSYAGHPPVLYQHSTEEFWSFARLAVAGRSVLSDCPPMNIPLGVVQDASYGQLAIPMAPGDRLFLYTDGITEASSPEGDFFGYARLKEVLDESKGAPLSELKSAVVKALHQHLRQGVTQDDITLIALEIC